MNIRFIYILIFSFFISLSLFAPPNGNGGGNNGGGPPNGGQPCWPPPCVPIDGGISLLIAAGAVYGGRKLYNNQKEKNSL